MNTSFSIRVLLCLILLTSVTFAGPGKVSQITKQQFKNGQASVLVLDFDGTLGDRYSVNWGEEAPPGSTLIGDFELDGEQRIMYMYGRPFLCMFLESMVKKFFVVIYTANEQKIAEMIGKALEKFCGSTLGDLEVRSLEHMDDDQSTKNLNNVVEQDLFGTTVVIEDNPKVYGDQRPSIKVIGVTPWKYNAEESQANKPSDATLQSLQEFFNSDASDVTKPLQPRVTFGAVYVNWRMAENIKLATIKRNDANLRKAAEPPTEWHITKSKIGEPQKPVLVLDFDGTLGCKFITKEEGQAIPTVAYWIGDITRNGKVMKVHMAERPELGGFIKRMDEKFYLVVYTANDQDIAELIGKALGKLCNKQSLEVRSYPHMDDNNTWKNLYNIVTADLLGTTVVLEDDPKYYDIFQQPKLITVPGWFYQQLGEPTIKDDKELLLVEEFLTRVVFPLSGKGALLPPADPANPPKLSDVYVQWKQTRH